MILTIEVLKKLIDEIFLLVAIFMWWYLQDKFLNYLALFEGEYFCNWVFAVFYEIKGFYLLVYGVVYCEEELTVLGFEDFGLAVVCSVG